MPILDNILQSIGNSPMVRLSHLNPNGSCELLGKVEFLNPGGSTKDRIALRMIKEAEESGQIKPGDTLIEPTSGNTGIGLAMAGAVLGYKVIIVMPEKMSQEKQRTMEALGAQIIRTVTTAAHDSPDSNFGVAERLQKAIPNSHILGQFVNPANPQAHFDTTAVEIIDQCEGKLDYFVAGTGTGGTLSGVARRLKATIPNCQIVGADPVGSLIGGGDLNAPYQVEGIGYDFVPETMDLSLVDRWEKVDDAESFYWAHQLIRKEGMLVGGSSGTALAAAIRIAKQCTGGERICVVLVDNVRNYMSKFLSNDWLAANGFSTVTPNKFVDWEAMKSSV